MAATIPDNRNLFRWTWLKIIPFLFIHLCALVAWKELMKPMAKPTVMGATGFQLTSEDELNIMPP